MNPNARRSMPGAPAPGMQLYDAPNCDYEPPKNFQQNFGNPYDCPEVSCDWLTPSILTSHWSMLLILTSHWSSILTSHSQGFYNASLMSSAGYSQVADYRYTTHLHHTFVDLTESQQELQGESHKKLKLTQAQFPISVKLTRH